MNKCLSKYLNLSGLTSEPVVLISTLYCSVHIKGWILVRDYRLNIGQIWTFVWQVGWKGIEIASERALQIIISTDLLSSNVLN